MHVVYRMSSNRSNILQPRLCLVGFVLVVKRGSVAQLALAIMLSFGFFSLQSKTWPYKYGTTLCNTRGVKGKYAFEMFT